MMQNRSLLRATFAEALGTGMLVFFGLGAVHAAVLTDAQQGVWQVAIVWGLGIAAAIYCTGSVSGAHLNPAVTLALVAWRRFPAAHAPGYILGQIVGSFAAAGLLFLLFSQLLELREQKWNVQRGQPGSVVTAMCYGEFFPNPGRLDDSRPYSAEEHAAFQKSLTVPQAFLAEAVGTMILVMVIFALGDPNNKLAVGSNLAPLMIGLTVASLISVLAPLTQACFNPARDFGPRLFSSLAGWEAVAWTLPGTASWFTVYILAPCAGGIAGGGVYRFLIEDPVARNSHGEA